MFSVWPGTVLLGYIFFLASDGEMDYLIKVPTLGPTAQWKNVETGLMDNPSFLPALVIALFCGALIGAFLTYRLRKKESLAALAQALDEVLSAAKGLSVPASRNTSTHSGQKQRAQVFVAHDVNQERYSKTEEISIVTLLQQVQSLRRIIDQAPRLQNKGEGRATEIKQATAPVVSRRATGETHRSQEINPGQQYDPESHGNLNIRDEIEHHAQTNPTTMTTESHRPTIGRRKDLAPAPIFGNATDALIQLYNSAVDNRGLRSDFRGRFQPLRIGTVNAPERRRDPNLPAEFREASDGNFFAVKLEEQSDYLVIPGFDMAVKHTSFEAGAIGEIFECPGYDPDLSYLFVKVRRPALFKVSGQNWELQHKGELDLGPGE